MSGREVPTSTALRYKNQSRCWAHRWWPTTYHALMSCHRQIDKFRNIGFRALEGVNYATVSCTMMILSLTMCVPPNRCFTQEKMKQFDACLIDCLPQRMCLVERCAAPRSGSNWIKFLNQPVLKIVAVSLCPTNCATRAKHQVFAFPCNESNVVQLEDQHLS